MEKTHDDTQPVGFGPHAPLTPTSSLGRCRRAGYGADTHCGMQFELVGQELGDDGGTKLRR
jgi:hypothetical protein